MLKLIMQRIFVRLLLAVALFSTAAMSARAIEVKVSANALERTLRAQLFNGPEGRYYLRGNPHSSCYVYADSPHVTFAGDRIVVHVHTRSRMGASVMGACVGLSLSTNADVSLVPEGEGESIGFRDARIERLSESRELNFLLVPFLSGKLPAQMKVNAADLARQLLTRSAETTGYRVTLNSLKMHSMLVQGDSLVLDVDASMNVD
ncbi:hypothetical protein [Edaphobacter sp.]|uniref:hypothetical protein n=1 Tax=Edaphobacter sp. TaxID=1934404 RepID=UPI002DB9FB69|nr:hypothetical protein [Edaphobacter sp.]HEU5342136.1 hypothetical protein [Edaphobacter sp.]